MACCSEKFATGAKCMLLVMLLAAIGVQVYAGVTCDFIGFSVGNQTGTIGLLYWQPISNVTGVQGEGCVQYPYQWNKNVFLTTSRTAMAVALGAAAVGALLVITDFIFCQLCLANVLKGGVMLIASLASGVVFTIFSNDYCKSGKGCTWGIGAILNVVALCLYFLNGILSACVPQVDPLCCRKKKEVEDQAPVELQPADKEVQMEEEPMYEDEPYDPAKHTDVGVSSKAEVNYAVTGTAY